MQEQLRKVGRVSGESVLKGSGKNWDEWILLLNRAGARQWTHQEIVAFMTVATRTMPLDRNSVWKFLQTPEALAVWLRPLDPFRFKAKQTFETEDGFFGEVRTLKEGERVRLSWQETDAAKASVLQVFLVARPKQKSILVFNHDSLKDGRLRNQMRDRWKSVLLQLLEIVTSQKGPAKSAPRVPKQKL